MTDVQLFSDRLNLPDPRWDCADFEFCSPLWKNDGVIAAANTRYDYVRCPCGEGHCEDVMTEQAADGTPVFYIRCHLTGHRQNIRPEELVKWVFYGETFADVLRKTFPCSGAFSEIIPDRLWKIGSSDIPLGNRRRDIYFATRLNTDSQVVFDCLPDTDTPILIHGSSRRESSGKYRNRVFSICDMIDIAADTWRIDYDYIREQLTGKSCEESLSRTKKSTLGRGTETVAKLETALRQWIESQYREKCECRSRGREFRYGRPTMGNLADMIGINKSTVSDLLEIKQIPENRKHHNLTVLWETAKDEDYAMKYARKYFGARFR